MKEKILKALGSIALDDVAPERLLDILLDAYKAKLARIEELEGENASEREKLYQDRESVRAELEAMRSNPLYGARGQYYFIDNGHKFFVQVTNLHEIELYQRLGGVDTRVQQVTSAQWEGMK